MQINEPPESSTLNQIPPQEAMAGVDFSSFFLSDCIIGTQGLSPEEKNLSPGDVHTKQDTEHRSPAAAHTQVVMSK